MCKCIEVFSKQKIIYTIQFHTMQRNTAVFCYVVLYMGCNDAGKYGSVDSNIQF